MSPTSCLPWTLECGKLPHWPISRYKTPLTVQSITSLTKRGVLYYCNNRLVVPALLRPQVLVMCHDSKSSAHFGINKTLYAIQSRFWWITWRQDVHAHVANCLKCAKNKPRAQAQAIRCSSTTAHTRSPLGFHIHGSHHRLAEVPQWK